jgi:hypothetical protein
MAFISCRIHARQVIRLGKQSQSNLSLVSKVGILPCQNVRSFDFKFLQKPALIGGGCLHVGFVGDSVQALPV